MSSPPSCLVAYANYLGTVFACSGTAQDVNCNPAGHKVTVEIYKDGKCPDTSGLSPGTWTSWEDVPEAIKNAFRCVDPKKTTQLDNSATISPCHTTPPSAPEGLGQTFDGAGGHQYVLVQSDPWLALPASTDFNPFHAPWESTGHPFPDEGPLAAIAAAHPTLERVRVQAELSISHLDEFGVVEHSRRVLLAGHVFASGRFLIRSAEPATQEGAATTSIQWSEWDRSALLRACDGEVASNAYSGSLAWFGQVFLDGKANGVRHLYDWVWNPLSIPRFQGIAYDVQPAEPDHAWIRRFHTDETATYLGNEYLVDESGPVAHPILARVYDRIGRLRREVRYLDYRALAEGVWRPMTIEVTDFPSGASAGPGPAIVTRLAVVSADLEPPAAPLTSLMDDPQQLWMVWQD